MELEALMELVAVVVVGRLCLSLLPPGWPGYHDSREGGATLGASVLLGSIGWRLLPLWIPWAALLAARLALLPGAMRPRHELPIPRGAPGGRVIVALALAALAWGAWAAPEGLPDYGALLAPVQAVASGLVVHDLAARLRRTALVRAAALALFAVAAALPLVLLPAKWGTAPTLLGAVWLVAGAWVFRRTADRRARWLAALGVAGAALVSPWGPLE